MKKVTEFAIDRKTWLRGEGSLDSKLLRKSDGKMCCVGFYCLALGMDENEIAGKYWPSERNGITPPKEAQWLNDSELIYSADLMFGLSGANDTISLDDSERETIIQGIFKKNGAEVTFHD